MKKISVILVLAISSNIMICKAQAPSWNINPLQYSYSLSYTGTALIDGLAAGDSSDMVAAFINNECRGVSSPVYIESAKKWVFFLTIYSNSSNDTIRFKYYQEENDSIYNMQTEVIFVANHLYGSALEPFVTANTEVNEALLLSYNIPGQIRSEIENDTVYITYPPDLGYNNISAVFNLSVGATAKVGEIVQFSGESENNYSSTLEYTIVSGDKEVENTYYIIADYYQMDITASPLIDGAYLNSQTDTVFAYLDNVLVSRSNAVFVTEIGKYRYQLHIENYANAGELSFKAYANELNDTIDLKDIIDFHDGDNRGTLYSPVQFSNTALAGNSIFSFSLPGQMKEARFGNDTITILMPPEANLTGLKPQFSLSDGAIAETGDSAQYSGYTQVDFSSLVTYKVYNYNRQTMQVYTVEVVCHEMNLIASVWLNNNENRTANDTLKAYINGDLAAYALPVFNGDIEKYRYYLKIIHYDDIGEISFKSKNDTETELITSCEFTAGKNKGTTYNPKILSDHEMEGANLISFSIPGQHADTRIVNNEVTIIMSDSISRAGLVSEFEVSPGATVKINDSVQYSGITKNNFLETVYYTVVNAMQSDSNMYSINVVYNEMDIIASVFIDKSESRLPNDTLEAFIDNKIVGWALPDTISDIYKQRYNLQIIHYDPEAEINFKLADNSDSLITLYNNLDFVNATSKGTNFKPVVLSDIPLAAKTIESFSINGQLGDTRILTNEIVVKMPLEIALDSLTPVFETGPGAQVMVNDSIQYAGYTENDFSYPIKYTVYNFDYSDSVSYNVNVVYYYMDLIATVVTDSIENIQPGDSLFAFINGTLSGRASALPVTSINKMRFPITMVHYDPLATVTFKYKDSQGNVFTLVNTVEFTDETKVGTVFNPVVLSDQVLQGTEITNLNIENQIGTTRINDNVVTVKMPKEADLNNLLANFELSPGASLFINDSIYYPDYTAFNFTVPVEAKVYNADRTLVKSYQIQLVKHFMKVTASVFIDSAEIRDVEYPIYALIDNELTQPKTTKVDEIDKIRFEFNIAHYDSVGTVKFGFGNPDQGKLFQSTVTYVDASTEGTLFEPFVLSNPLLNKARILSFTLPGQRGATVFEDTLIKVVMDEYVDLTNVAPAFSISAGSQLYINGSVFYSAYTTTDFTKPVKIKVLSADGSTQRQYLFSVLEAVFVDFVASTIVSPNGDGANDTWEIKDVQKYFESAIMIFDQQGRIVYESIGYDNTWDGRYEGNLLPRGTYMYIVKSQEGTVNKGTISLIY